MNALQKSLTVMCIGLLTIPMLAAAQDMANLNFQMDAQKLINFGKANELRTLIDDRPDFATMSAGMFDMSMIDLLLCDAAYAKQARVEIVELLLDSGGSPDQNCVPSVDLPNATAFDRAFIGHYATTPAMKVADTILGPPMWPAKRVDGAVYLEIAEILLDEKAQADLTSVLFKYSVLNPEVAEWALERGADPDAMTFDGRTTRELITVFSALSEDKLAVLRGESQTMTGVQP